MSDSFAIRPKTSPAGDFEDFFENAPCGYLILEPDGRIQRANILFAGWIGSPKEQLAGKHLHDVITLGTRIFYETNFAPRLSMYGVCEEMSLDLRTAGGNSIAVSASARM